MGYHAPCSPSVLKRRLGCPGSLQLEPLFEGMDNEASSMGTKLHALMEKEIITDQDTDDLDAYSLEALQAAQEFENDLRAKLPDDAQIYKEYKVDLAFLHPLIGEGTIDFLAVVPFEMAYIMDWKFFYQKDTDPAESNIQIQTYALGVMRAFEVDKCELIVYMPHQKVWSSHTFMAKDSYHLISRIKASSLSWKSFYFAVDSYCKYCKAMPICPAFLKEMMENADKKKDDKPNPAILPALLDVAEHMDDWAGSVKQHAYQELMTGAKIPGWGLYQGYGHRTWKSEKEAENILINLAKSKGKDSEMIYDPKTLKSPAQVEKIVGKAKDVRELMEGLTYKPTTAMQLKRIKEDSK